MMAALRQSRSFGSAWPAPASGRLFSLSDLCRNQPIPIQALALWGAVAAGALLLRRSGSSYRALGLNRPASWRTTIGWAAATLVLAWTGTAAVGVAIHSLTDGRPLDVGYIRASIEGNTAAWLIWMALVV
jgi:hypothetical protein